MRPSINQIDDLIEEIQIRREKDERVLVTTLTKRMAEELQKYLDKLGIPCRYIHSDVDTLERVEILRQLRLGEFDVLIGVNLLREDWIYLKFLWLQFLMQIKKVFTFRKIVGTNSWSCSQKC